MTLPEIIPPVDIRFDIDGVRPDEGFRRLIQSNPFDRADWESAVVLPQANTVMANALWHAFTHGPSYDDHFVNHQGLSLKITHGYYLDHELNAFATRVEDRYYVGVSSRTYHACLDVAFTLLATRGVLTELGHHNIEQVRSAEYVLGTKPWAFSDPFAYTRYLQDNMPKDETRRTIAHIVAQHMVTFFFFHEQGHIILGHVDRSDGGRAVRTMSERRWAPDAATDLIEEIDADNWATKISLSPPSVRLMQTNWTSVSLTRNQWIALIWLSIALSGALLAQIDLRELRRVDEWGTHPHGIIRARHVIHPSWLSELNDRFGEFPDEITITRTEYESAWGLAFSWLLDIGKVWPQYRLFPHALAPAGDAEGAVKRLEKKLARYEKQYADMVRTFGCKIRS